MAGSDGRPQLRAQAIEGRASLYRRSRGRDEIEIGMGENLNPHLSEPWKPINPQTLATKTGNRDRGGHEGKNLQGRTSREEPPGKNLQGRTSINSGVYLAT